MASKPSATVRSIVVQATSESKWIGYLRWGVLALALIVGFLLGYIIIGDGYRKNSEALAAEVERSAALSEQLSAARQLLANLEVGSEVDRQSVEQTRQLVKGLQDEVSDLREEIAFYRGLMAPSEQEKGVGIRSWEVTPTPIPNRYHYKLVVQQLALKHRVLKGLAKVVIVGTDAEGERRYALSELTEASASLRLRFKYFQALEGELTLPEGFSPSEVQVEVVATSPKKAETDRQFDWLVIED